MMYSNTSLNSPGAIGGPLRSGRPTARERSGDPFDAVVQQLGSDPATPPKLNIRGIPTLILFKNGTVEAQKVGAVTKSQLAAFLDSNL